MKRLLYLLLLAAPAAIAGVVIDDPWAAATPPGASVGGGYFVVRNTDAVPDRLIGASSPFAERVEMHVSSSEGGVMRMRQHESLAVPANGRLELTPGGAHLMLIGLKLPLKQGDIVPLTLRFERAGDVKTELRVGKLGARSHAH
ncbi:MAG: copper chaperone PCu(A)C [Burkholderiales bacterium]